MYVNKMSTFKSINSFLWVSYIAFVGAEELCGQQYTLPEWESDWDNFPPPGNFTIGPPPECPQGLEVRIHELRENFSLSLFANPFIKNENDCPPAESKYLDLRKFHESHTVTEGNYKSKMGLFSKIFTGCYYVEMKNAEGRKWIWDPSFQRRGYHYHDTTLKCNNFQLSPEEQNQSSQLRYNITIPLTCSRLRCQVLDQETKHTKDVLDSGKIPAIQDCFITYNGNGVKPLLNCSIGDTHLQLSADNAVDKGQGWQVNLRLSHFKKGIEFYSVKWEQHINNCNIIVGDEQVCEDFNQKNPRHMTRGDLMTWTSVINFGAFIHVIANVTNLPPDTVSSGFWRSPVFIMSLSILLGVIVTIPLVYWMSKYAKVFLRRKHTLNNLFVNSPESEPDQEESDHILLLYAHDSPKVMRAMKALRDRLQQISQFPIHDLYSDDEANIIMSLGATGWVENRLSDGSRAVWVDTPQFRSVLKDSKLNKGQQKQRKIGDFRDEALPYAVELVTNSFQNATTQYRCHFVVRLEGLEVDDGNDDPLRVISPHVRYSIPEHLDLLCKDLAR